MPIGDFFVQFGKEQAAKKAEEAKMALEAKLALEAKKVTQALCAESFLLLEGFQPQIYKEPKLKAKQPKLKVKQPEKKATVNMTAEVANTSVIPVTNINARRVSLSTALTMRALLEVAGRASVPLPDTQRRAVNGGSSSLTPMCASGDSAAP